MVTRLWARYNKVYADENTSRFAETRIASLPAPDVDLNDRQQFFGICLAGSPD